MIYGILSIVGIGTKKIIIKEISLINKIDKNKLLDSRIERYDKMGIFSESQ